MSFRAGFVTFMCQCQITSLFHVRNLCLALNSSIQKAFQFMVYVQLNTVQRSLVNILCHLITHLRFVYSQ